MNTGLDSKTVLITGGSSGIGKATALAFGSEKARVVITYYQGESAAQKIAETIERKGGSALAVYMNLNDENSITNAVQTAAQKFGGIDVLVNNAVSWGNGGSRSKEFEEVPLSHWKKTVGINLFGTVKVTQETVGYMRKAKWGRVINISSDIAFDSMKGSGPYGSLKSALFGFTANLVEELSQDGILSNVVIPGWTLTERAIHFFPAEFRKKAVDAFPTGRATLPEDIASMVLYLGSAANGHVNGEHIRVTGSGSQPMLNSFFKEYMKSASK